jgi:hypothetical protein
MRENGNITSFDERNVGSTCTVRACGPGEKSGPAGNSTKAVVSTDLAVAGVADHHKYLTRAVPM